MVADSNRIVFVSRCFHHHFLASGFGSVGLPGPHLSSLQSGGSNSLPVRRQGDEQMTS